MKSNYTAILTAAILVSGSLGLMAYNPYEGQYEVNHIDARRSSFEYKPGEIILKFKADNSG